MVFKRKEVLVIGRRDKADFPELGITGIDVKIDTGAYTSSIHCHNIQLFKVDDKDYVKFNLLDPKHLEYNEKEYSLPVYKKKVVKSSTGIAENRLIVKTKIKLFRKIYPIELSLADRSSMRYPVLLGRKLLKRRFVVNVSETDLSFKHKNKK